MEAVRMTSMKAPLSELDRLFMDAAVRLGASRLGKTAPNPAVGTIIVQHDEEGARIVGRGVTADGGRPHAEVIALQQAGEAARGATCYVSLEPCSHFGKTPPCVDALIRAGIARVVIGVDDPDPRVSGNGVKRLSDAGVHVNENVLVHESRAANDGHIRRVIEERPAVTLKLAVSADGKIGRAWEAMTQITGTLARRQVHAMRARADVLLTGVGTILADDPDLTCRLPGMREWSPTRVVLDTHARTPVDARLFDGISVSPVHVIVGEDADEARTNALMEQGARITHLPQTGSGLDLKSVLTLLGSEGVTNVMAECGQGLATNLLKHDLVDRLALFNSPTEIGADGVDALLEGHTFEAFIEANGFQRASDAVFDVDRLTVWER